MDCKIQKYTILLACLVHVFSQNVEDCPALTVNHYHYTSNGAEPQQSTPKQELIGRPGKIGPRGPTGNVGPKVSHNI